MSGYGTDNGRVSKPGGKWEHWCDADGCKAWGTYGYKTKYGQLWFCYEHKQEGEDALAGRRQ
jgi:hypothetical protein